MENGIDKELHDLLRAKHPCVDGPCPNCGYSGVDPAYTQLGMNGERLIYVLELPRLQAEGDR